MKLTVKIAVNDYRFYCLSDASQCSQLADAGMLLFDCTLSAIDCISATLGISQIPDQYGICVQKENCNTTMGTPSAWV